MKLYSVYFGTGRDIYVDRYFTSHGLVCDVMLQNLTVIGTAMANRREVPSLFKAAKEQKEERMKTPREGMTILTKFCFCHMSSNATRMYSWCIFHSLPFQSLTATKTYSYHRLQLYNLKTAHWH